MAETEHRAIFHTNIQLSHLRHALRDGDHGGLLRHDLVKLRHRHPRPRVVDPRRRGRLALAPLLLLLLLLLLRRRLSLRLLRRVVGFLRCLTLYRVVLAPVGKVMVMDDISSKTRAMYRVSHQVVYEKSVLKCFLKSIRSITFYSTCKKYSINQPHLTKGIASGT